MNLAKLSNLINSKKVRDSTEYLIIGIDVPKDKHHAFMGNATGKSKTTNLKI